MPASAALLVGNRKAAVAADRLRCWGGAGGGFFRWVWRCRFHSVMLDEAASNGKTPAFKTRCRVALEVDLRGIGGCASVAHPDLATQAGIVPATRRAVDVHEVSKP